MILQNLNVPPHMLHFRDHGTEFGQPWIYCGSLLVISHLYSSALTPVLFSLKQEVFLNWHLCSKNFTFFYPLLPPKSLISFLASWHLIRIAVDIAWDFGFTILDSGLCSPNYDVCEKFQDWKCIFHWLTGILVLREAISKLQSERKHKTFQLGSTLWG